MRCKHINTRKLFWSNTSPNKWMRTEYSICLDCDAIVGLQPVKIVEKDLGKSIREKTKDAFCEVKA